MSKTKYGSRMIIISDKDEEDIDDDEYSSLIEDTFCCL